MKPALECPSLTHTYRNGDLAGFVLHGVDLKEKADRMGGQIQMGDHSTKSNA